MKHIQGKHQLREFWITSRFYGKSIIQIISILLSHIIFYTESGLGRYFIGLM